MKKSKTQKILLTSVKKILYPIVKMFVQKGIPCRVFEEILRSTFVDVAKAEFNLDGKKTTNSRTAVLTGLSRKEVLRLLKLEQHPEGESEEQKFINRASKVLTAWCREPKYCNSKGEPATLHIESGERSFQQLVKDYSGDMTYRAVMDELLRVGAIKVLNAKRVKMVRHGYVQSRGEDEMLSLMGEDAAHLIKTILFNIENKGKVSRFQKKVMYHTVPKEVIPMLKKLVYQKSQATLEEIDRFLALHDFGEEEPENLNDYCKSGLGIYYFEDNCER